MDAANKKRGPLHAAMGRPKRGILSTYPSTLRTLIKQIRTKNPGYGASTIRSELIYHYGFKASELPGLSQISAYLKAAKLTRLYEHHSALPKPNEMNVKFAHQLWQLDGRGNEKVGKLGAIALLNIKDVLSKAYISCYPAPIRSMQGHPCTADYQKVLRLGFMDFGLPLGLQTDHASVFYDNNTKSPFPTRFHLWLIALGIELIHSRKYRPTDQAVVERAHEILYQQVLRNTDTPNNWEELFKRCQHRRQALNYHIPSRSCNDQPPLIARPNARKSNRDYAWQAEADFLQLKRVYQYLNKCKWYRKVAANKMVFLGGHAYYIKQATPGEQLEILFCESCQYLIFKNDQALLVGLKPIKGISKEDLMGDAQKIGLPNCQLTLPLFKENWGDTTFPGNTPSMT